jgi:hypothetical protein
MKERKFHFPPDLSLQNRQWPSCINPNWRWTMPCWSISAREESWKRLLPWQWFCSKTDASSKIGIKMCRLFGQHWLLLLRQLWRMWHSPWWCEVLPRMCLERQSFL